MSPTFVRHWIVVASTVLANVSFSADGTIPNASALTGWYSQMPIDASDSGSRTVGLTMLFLEHVPPLKGDAVSTISAVRLTISEEVLTLVLRDSQGHSIPIEQRIFVQRQPGASSYEFTRRWSLEGSGETGPSRGDVVTSFSLDVDGSLRVETLHETDASPGGSQKQAPVRSRFMFTRLRE